MKTCRELEKELLFEDGFAIIDVDNSILTEQKYGQIPNTKISIHIEGSEGPIPHIHIQGKNGKKENCICHVKLLSAEYLRDINDPCNTLDSSERKALNIFMHKNSPGLNISNWEIILSRWNAMNPKYIVNINRNDCPDYTKLK